MEPLGGLEGQVSALQRTLRLLVGLLIPCLLLLFLLSALLLVRWRLCRRAGGQRVTRGPLNSPRPFLSAPKAAGLRHDPGGAAEMVPTGPLATCCSRRAAVSCLPRSSPRFRRQEGGAALGTGSSSANVEKLPILVPPNSPVTISGTGGDLEKAFPSCHTSTQSKPPWSCSRLASAIHSSTGPFEFGSSIRPGDKRTHLNSANFTASQGPGLDSDFGASAGATRAARQWRRLNEGLRGSSQLLFAELAARNRCLFSCHLLAGVIYTGVSLRILSTDSEGSPDTPVLLHQQAELFEWDYYDPSYKKRVQLHHPLLPPMCSKQYWL